METPITASNLPYRDFICIPPPSSPSVRSVRPDSLDRPLKILPEFLPSTTSIALKVHWAARTQSTKPKEIFICFFLFLHPIFCLSDLLQQTIYLLTAETMECANREMGNKDVSFSHREVRRKKTKKSSTLILVNISFCSSTAQQLVPLKSLFRDQKPLI